MWIEYSQINGLSITLFHSLHFSKSEKLFAALTLAYSIPTCFRSMRLFWITGNEEKKIQCVRNTNENYNWIYLIIDINKVLWFWKDLALCIVADERIYAKGGQFLSSYSYSLVSNNDFWRILKTRSARDSYLL